MTVTTVSSKPKFHSVLFPDFSRLSEADYPEYESFISQFPQHCDYTLNNLLVWLAGDKIVEYSWLNGNLVLRFHTSFLFGPSINTDHDRVWHTVLGVNEPDATVDELLRSPEISELMAVPDYFVDKLTNAKNYLVTEDLGNRDYILDIENLVRKSGKVYENFRYQVSYSLKHHSEEAVVKELDLSDLQSIRLIINALHMWPKVNSFEKDANDEHRADADALQRLFLLQPKLPTKHKCIGLFIHGQLQGFSIYHIPTSNNHIAMGNHIKCNGEYKRLFDFIVYITATRLRTHGVTLINAEQDMNIEGIRHHKMYYNPVTFYRRYTLSAK